MGKLATTIEWGHCIISPKHAKNTWLRIQPSDEKNALLLTEIIVGMLCLALIPTSMRAWTMYKIYRQSQQTEQSIQILKVNENRQNYIEYRITI